jgi:hypothetical protein
MLLYLVLCSMSVVISDERSYKLTKVEEYLRQYIQHDKH